MPLTLSGTNGVSGVDGSASTPANRGSDTNTGIVYGTDTVQIATGGTTAVTVDSSQNVGIGTASPAVKLELSGASASGIISARISNTTNGNNGQGTSVQFYGWDAGVSANIKSLREGQPYSPSYLSFETYGGAGTTGTNTLAERMRIDGFGNLLVGTTSVGPTVNSAVPITTLKNVVGITDGTKAININGTNGNQGIFFNDTNLRVYNNSGAGVYLASGGTSWTASSDERLKNIVSEISYATDKVNTLRAVNFTWKSDVENALHVGLIAQDVQNVLPEAVSELDGYLGVQYTDVIPLLVASIKELSAKLDAAEARIAALEAK